MKKWTLVMLLLGVLLALVGCGSEKNAADNAAANSQNQEKRVVRIGYPQYKGDFASDLFGIAQDTGILKSELSKIGVKPELIPFAAQGGAVNQALVSKDVDIAVYGDVPAITLLSKGVAASIIAINNESLNSAIVVRNDSPINSVKELKGKKIAVTKGTVSNKVLIAALVANGIAENEVEIINMNSNSEAALVNGSIDALAQSSTVAATIAFTKKEGKILVDSKDHPEWAGSYVTLGRNEFLKENPDIAIAIIKSLINAKEYITNNKDAAYNIWTKAGADLESSKYVYGFDKDFSYFSIKITDNGIKKINEDKSFLLKSGFITNDFDLAKIIDKSFYEKAITK